MRRCERLGDCRHADRVAAKQPDGADFCRSFKLRSRHEEIHALVDAKRRVLCKPQSKLPQARGIHPADIKETVSKLGKVLPTHGARTIEFYVVGDDHDIARPISLVHAARRVRYNQLFDAQELEKPHGNRQLLKIVPFIGVEPARHTDELLSLQRAKNQLARVVGRGGDKKVRNVPIVDLDRVFDLLCKRPQSSSQNQPQLRRKRRSGFYIVRSFFIKRKRFVHASFLPFIIIFLINA